MLFHGPYPNLCGPYYTVGTTKVYSRDIYLLYDDVIVLITCSTWLITALQCPALKVLVLQPLSYLMLGILIKCQAGTLFTSQVTVLVLSSAVYYAKVVW